MVDNGSTDGTAAVVRDFAASAQFAVLHRVRAWGPRRTLPWYWDRRYQPATAAAMNVR